MILNIEPEGRDAPSAGPGPGPSSARPADRIVESAELFKAERRVWIRHGESLYRLSITRQGKLILGK
jgi:hemin uptake protein HemP